MTVAWKVSAGPSQQLGKLFSYLKLHNFLDDL
jgi:hypothetical protein